METTIQVILAVAVGLWLLFETGVGLWLFEKSMEFVGQFYELKTSLEPSEEPSPAPVGSIGTALTDLRPTGAADVNGRRMHVVAVRGLIEKGCSVRVLRVEGNRIYVDRMSGEADASDTDS